MTTLNIWEHLTFDNIINTVEAVTGSRLTNICQQRNSYINRVYELEKEDPRERLIIKFYRPNRWTREMILAEHSFLGVLYRREIPVIPPLEIGGSTLFDFMGIPFALFPKRGGRALDEFDRDTWLQVGRLIGRMHLVSRELHFPERILWVPSVATRQHLDTILASRCLLPEFEQAFMTTAELFISKADSYFKDVDIFPLHGDCHRGNLLIRPGEGIYLTDFDDMATGPAVQDIWMLLPDPSDPESIELEWLLQGYETFCAFSRSTLTLIPWLRGMRLIHFVAWSAIQSNDPHFTQTFVDWGTPRYWNEIIRELQGIVFGTGEENEHRHNSYEPHI